MNKWVREFRGVVLALVLGCSLLSCNPSSPSPRVPRETVRGKVTYKGEPLPVGFLHFYDGTNYVGIGVIKPDGSGAYEALVPAGSVQVIVKEESRPDRVGMPPERGPHMPPGRPRPVSHIPGLVLEAKQARLMDEVQKKYGSLRTEKPLTFVVGPGEQTWNINLD